MDGKFMDERLNEYSCTHSKKKIQNDQRYKNKTLKVTKKKDLKVFNFYFKTSTTELVKEAMFLFYFL